MALEASLAFAPDKAAALLIPLIAITESSSFMPAFVNLPILVVISENEYIVSSEYLFKSSSLVLTTSKLSPVLAIMVCIAPIFNSYSLNPVFTGSIVSDDKIRLLAAKAVFVKLAMTVAPTTSNAENLA